MFKRFTAVLLMVLSASVFAEASFQQIEGLIEQKNYAAAELGLEGIIAAHPQSAKAFYAMAQAQAGLGHLEKAQYALNKARGIDPELKFASSSNIESLQTAITPQVAKIEVVTESHILRNTILLMLVLAGLYFIYTVFARKQDEEDGFSARPSSGGPTPPTSPTSPSTGATAASSNAAFAARSYTPPAATASIATSGPAVQQYTYTPQPAPTVVNNHYGSNNDGLLTGMVIGNMMSNSHHHDTVIVERDVYVQPAPVYSAPEPVYTPPARSSTWDDTPAPSKSSTWDDTPSTPSRSSSWDDDISSSKSSSSSWSSSGDSSSSWSDSSSSSDSSSGSDW
jgi:hypothetical protein